MIEPERADPAGSQRLLEAGVKAESLFSRRFVAMRQRSSNGWRLPVTSPWIVTRMYWKDRR